MNMDERTKALEANQLNEFVKLVELELLSLRTPTGKVTHRDLAKEIGVSDATLSNWLNGYVKLETFKDKVLAGLNRLKK